MPTVDVSKLSILRAGPRPESKTNPFDDKTALSLVMRYSEGEARNPVKYALEKQWYVTTAFYAGQQFLVWDDLTGFLREPRPRSSRVNIVANKIISSVLRSMAILGSATIPWKPVAGSTDREDMQASRVADGVLHHFKHVLDVDAKQLEAELWAQLCGTVFIKPVWDPFIGDRTIVWKNPQTGMPIPNEIVDANPALKKELEKSGAFWEFRQGAIRLDVVNPFRVLVDPYAAKHEDLRWLMESQTRPMSYYYQRFPEKSKGINLAKSEEKINSFEKRILSLNGVFNTTGPVISEYDEPVAEEKELWLAPYAVEADDGAIVEYPYGRHIIEAGGKILLDHENEYLKMGYPGHGFPHEPLFYAPITGRYWGMSHVEHLIPIQRLYNFTRSKVAEMFRLMGSKKWLVPRDANVSARSLTSGIEVIEWDSNATGGAKPEQIQPVGPAPEFMDIQNRCNSDMQEISSQPEVTKGVAPGSVRSGVAFRALQQKALLPNSPIIRQREITWSKVGTKVLILAGENVTEEMVLKIWGRSRASQVNKFIGADLKGNYDVIVPKGSMMPEGQAEVEELVFSAVDRGVLNPADPNDRETIFRMIRFSENEEYFREREGDRYIANKENEIMTDPRNPQFPDINEFDDHQIHLKELNKMRKSDIYFSLPSKIRSGIDWHGRQHEKKIAEAQQRQMAMIEQSKGAASPKGKAPAAAPQPSAGPGPNLGG